MNRVIALVALFCPVLAVAADGEDDGSNIPREFSVGVGIGIIAPTTVLAPNTASVRFRIDDSVTIEPIVEFDLGNVNTRQEAPDIEVVDSTRRTDLTVAALGRFQLAERGNVELQALGGARVNWSSSVNDPEGTENNTTTSFLGLGLDWGVGVNWWVSPNFALSGDATNGLVSVRSSKTSPEVGESSTSSNGLDVSVGWDPTIRMMGHVFF